MPPTKAVAARGGPPGAGARAVAVPCHCYVVELLPLPGAAVLWSQLAAAAHAAGAASRISSANSSGTLLAKVLGLGNTVDPRLLPRLHV